MSKITSIGTAVPGYRHRQEQILDFMQRVFAPGEQVRRKLSFLYRQSAIETRYSVLPDYSSPASAWQFYPATENLEPFPDLDKRMLWYNQHASTLAIDAIQNCIKPDDLKKITHLITVSCTGMSAPGLDIELMEILGLSPSIIHTSVNFMGCYAAIHAMRLADAFCKNDRRARVMVVCIELCTLHFQKTPETDNMISSMLFSDGAAAIVICGDDNQNGLHIDHFQSEVSIRGKKDMAWQLSTGGFLMTLSSYVADLVEEDFNKIVNVSLNAAGVNRSEISRWCIHPGGKRVLEAVHQSLGFTNGQLDDSYEILRNYGNMSSPTVLFVLERIWKNKLKSQDKIFGAAFGPGLSFETFILSA